MPQAVGQTVEVPFVKQLKNMSQTSRCLHIYVERNYSFKKKEKKLEIFSFQWWKLLNSKKNHSELEVVKYRFNLSQLEPQVM